MKLASFRVFQEEIPLAQPFTISYHTTESTTLHFVEWQTDTGHHGWGSASPGQRVTGETDENGACVFSGFYGRYKLLVKSESGRLFAVQFNARRKATHVKLVINEVEGTAHATID